MKKLIGQVRLVKAVSWSTLAMALAMPAVPAFAQDTMAEARLRKLEAEIRAMQRVVFPGSDGKVFTPQIQAGSASTAPGVGQPATSAVTDLLARMETLEAQIARLTGEIEQNAHRIAQLEARVGITAVPTAVVPTPGALPDPSPGTTPAATVAPVPTPTPTPTPAPVSTPAAPEANLSAMTGGASA